MYRSSVRGVSVPMVYLGTILSVGSAGTALAQEASAPAEAAASAAPGDTQLEEVVVTGYRAALQSALALKRDAAVMVDAINAEDIADFPDANLAESLQRLPGIAIDRDSGEGRVTRIWFARERGWLPLRIQQVEADGETLDMRIVAIR